MKKNSKYLIIALACVVVLGGAVAALTLTGGTGEDTTSSAPASSSCTLALIEKTDEDLASVTVTNETGTITIHAHPETVETSSEAASSGSESASSEAAEPQTEVVYEVDGLEGLALNDNVSTLAKAGYSLTAQKSIGTVENPEEFGLTDPTATVSAVYQDGSTYSYSIGVENGGYYYVQPDGSDEVYLASISSVLFDSVNDLADTALFELEIGEDTSSAAPVLGFNSRPSLERCPSLNTPTTPFSPSSAYASSRASVAPVPRLTGKAPRARNSPPRNLF